MLLTSGSQSSYPVHWMTLAVPERVNTKIPLNGKGPTQSPWAWALLLSEQGEHSRGECACSGRKQTKATNRVLITIRNMFCEQVHEFF